MRAGLEQIDMPIAFILGRYITTGLGVVRCLGQKKTPVIWLDSNPRQIGFHSRYCKGIVTPNPKNNPEEYIDFLLTIGEKLNHKGVLLPIGDIEVLAILKNRTKLEKFYHIPIADLQVTEKLLNKYLFYKTLEKLNIDHPKTYFPNDISEVEKISGKIGYPCILKPYHSAFFVLDFKTKLFKAGSKEQLIQFYKKATSKNHKVMIQEIIPGDARNMHGFNAYYDKNFTPHGIFMYKRIREWPHEFGNGCLIESVKLPELEEIINPLIEKLKFYGIIDAEIRKDPRDDKFKLIEINPRCWMQVSFPARYGINLPYIAYMSAIEKKFTKPTLTSDSIRYLFISEDIRSSLKSIKKRELTFGEWIKSYRGKKEYAVFSWNDPLPFFIFKKHIK